jgi:hypothetical protein
LLTCGSISLSSFKQAANQPSVANLFADERFMEAVPEPVSPSPVEKERT